MSHEGIERIEAAKEELRLAKVALKKKDVFYSIGDRFVGFDDSSKHMLTSTELDVVIMASLSEGHRHGNSKEVGDFRKITQAEFNEHWGDGGFTRYWDSQKNEYTDGRTTIDEFTMECSTKGGGTPKVEWNNNKHEDLFIAIDQNSRHSCYMSALKKELLQNLKKMGVK